MNLSRLQSPHPQVMLKSSLPKRVSNHPIQSEVHFSASRKVRNGAIIGGRILSSLILGLAVLSGGVNLIKGIGTNIFTAGPYETKPSTLTPSENRLSQTIDNAIVFNRVYDKEHIPFSDKPTDLDMQALKGEEAQLLKQFNITMMHDIDPNAPILDDTTLQKLTPAEVKATKDLFYSIKENMFHDESGYNPQSVKEPFNIWVEEVAKPHLSTSDFATLKTDGNKLLDKYQALYDKGHKVIDAEAGEDF